VILAVEQCLVTNAQRHEDVCFPTRLTSLSGQPSIETQCPPNLLSVRRFRITQSLASSAVAEWALKFLPYEMAQDSQLLERFQREARAASALNHPNICTVHAIEQFERQHFIVMELLEGQTLGQMIGRQPFEINELLVLAIQITDALESAHAKGIVHRDIKPANILLFQGDTSAVIFDAILNREPIPVYKVNSAIPMEFGRLLNKAMEKDRNLRCQTATELKTDLNRLKRDLDSGNKRAAESGDSPSTVEKQGPKSIAVLYFENLSGIKEDEYFRDGVTEDIITELSKIKGLNTFSRPTVLAYRDKQVTPAGDYAEMGREEDALRETTLAET
jgi:hypothetical protein